MNLYDVLLVNVIYNVILLQFFIILSFVLLIISLIFWLKTKKKYWIAVILFALFGVYQVVPHFYEVKAATSSNDELYVKNYEMAIKTAVIPMQKAMLCSTLASYYGSKNLPLSIEYYEKTYKYTKNYESGLLWASAALTYYLSGDFNKVIEIADSVKGSSVIFYSLQSQAYIMKNDFSNALIAINKELEERPSSWSALALRANIYRNLNKEKEASQDYDRALNLCKNENACKKVDEYYNNKNCVKDNWNRMREYFKSKGGILN